MALSFKLSFLFFLSLNSLLFHCDVSLSRILDRGTDREALLEFKAGLDQESLAVLASWNNSQAFCQWDGVICSHKHSQRVVELNLQGHNLVGSLSPVIGNLSFLKVLNLANNSFRGQIPLEVGNLVKLKVLNISHNSFQGDIPSSLANCSSLINLALEHNKFHGHLPSELGSLSKLHSLSLHDNNLTGFVPPSFGNLSSLEQLLLFTNQLQGEIPSTISLLSNLKQLGLAGNKFYGSFPSAIYNLSSLQVVSLAFNSFSGHLRPDIGLVLPELQVLLLSTNNLSGPIPTSLANASSLTDLDLSTNSFIGAVPWSFGYLQGLTYVNLEENLLGGDASDDLEFITSLTNCSYLALLSLDGNNFQSSLPMSITNLSTELTWVSLGRNYIQGSIMEGMSKLSNLYVFSVEENLLTGTIPDSLGQLSKLQVLSLAANNLTGKLPLSLGNISGLSSLLVNDNYLEGRVPSNIRVSDVLDLSANDFNDSIPSELFEKSTTYWVNMSSNHFSGLLPLQIGMWTGLTTLDVSNNRLSGTIPVTIRQCLSLEELHMQNNLFHGSVPYLGELKGIRWIDLSYNNLTGQIPSYMANLSALQYLNLSFNRLEGEVSIEGVFHNASAFDIHGNIGLCGGMRELHLEPCPVKKQERTGKHIDVKYILLAVLLPLLLGFILLSSVFYCRRKRKMKQQTLSASPSKCFFPKISYKDLCNATDGFSQANFIGSGTFGTVYKGALGQEEAIVAVKVLNLQQHGALKSFMAECNALRKIRHRNLVKVLTACSSIDFRGNEFKAIVYPFMSNGSLETWLNPDEEQVVSKHLTLLQRINIATDVACALYYLHDECETPVVHCDLKPSNVLLDNELTAHVSDFGLARLVSTSGDNNIVSQLSSAGIKGTIGYAAPEYGMGSDVSPQGDVYSFGILLLEMFTGRKPTDEQFQGNFNLHNFVKRGMSLSMGVLEIADQSLISEVEELEVSLKDRSCQKQEWIECLISILQVGLSCSEESPQARMKMEEVTLRLAPIRDKFLKANLRRQHAHKTDNAMISIV